MRAANGLVPTAKSTGAESAVCLPAAADQPSAYGCLSAHGGCLAEILQNGMFGKNERPGSCMGSGDNAMHIRNYTGKLCNASGCGGRKARLIIAAQA